MLQIISPPNKNKAFFTKYTILLAKDMQLLLIGVKRKSQISCKRCSILAEICNNMKSPSTRKSFANTEGSCHTGDVGFEGNANAVYQNIIIPFKVDSFIIMSKLLQRSELTGICRIN